MLSSEESKTRRGIDLANEHLPVKVNDMEPCSAQLSLHTTNTVVRGNNSITDECHRRFSRLNIFTH